MHLVGIVSSMFVIRATVKNVQIKHVHAHRRLPTQIHIHPVYDRWNMLRDPPRCSGSSFQCLDSSEQSSENVEVEPEVEPEVKSENDDQKNPHPWAKSTRQFAAIQLVGYCFRQRLYNELLNDGRIIDTVQHHPADIWYLIVLPTALMVMLKDSYKKRSFEKLRELYLSEDVQWTRMGEFIVLGILMIFTKDVESVL